MHNQRRQQGRIGGVVLERRNGYGGGQHRVAAAVLADDLKRQLRVISASACWFAAVYESRNGTKRQTAAMQ